MTGGQPDPGFRYWAFISYSHTDKSWGAWLHKALETYSIPRRLVGTPIAAGTVPARLTPVFRDRDELPTATDLGYTIEEALRQSWCLIVICSPASAKSRWVNEEVLAFQKLDRSGRIHCLIVEGGSDAAATPCFPPALAALMHVDGDTIGEPIGADARADADGRTNAKLKLIAGILGVGFDKLVRREQHRRHRNLFLVTCASLLLAAVLAVFAIVTVTSRRDADSQRNHAEGLVEFMLGDLRKKLEPDGKLATLDAVGKEALAYYAAQKPATLDADALARRARALQQIGEVFNLRGQLDDALGVFKQAAETTAELLERDADNAQRIFDHAQSVFWVGYVDYQRGDFATAALAFEKYKLFADRLIEIDPMNEEWQAELGYAHSNLGVVLLAKGEPDRAEPLLRRELEMAQAHSRKSPTDVSRQVRSAQAHAWLADARWAQGDIDGAVVHRDAEIATYESVLALNPHDHATKGALSVAERTLSALTRALGDTRTATAQARRAVKLAAELVDIDPDNTRWIEAVSAGNLTLEESLFESGSIEDARAAMQLGKRFAGKLIDREPSVLSWRYRWAAALVRESQYSLHDGDGISALRHAQAALQSLQNVSGQAQRDVERTPPAAKAYLAIAEANSALGKKDDSKRALAHIVQLHRKAVRHADPQLQGLYAVALRGLNEDKEAHEIERALSDIGYRDPGYLRRIRTHN